MAEDFTIVGAYAKALDLNRTAFAAGHYEAAYHFLMAALHCAEDACDTARLAEVSRVCREQLRIIDAQSPEHRVSSATARGHGHRSIYEMGASTADAAHQRLEIQHRLAEHRKGT